MIFDSILHGKIGSNMMGFGKGYDLDQLNNNLHPYVPYKDVSASSYYAFLGRGK